MGRKTIVQFFFILSLCLQLVFYHLPAEIKFASFFLCLLFLTLFWVQTHSLRVPKFFTFFFFFYLLSVFFSGLASPTPFTTTLKISETLGIFLLVIVCLNFFSETKFFLRTFAVLTLLGFIYSLDGIFEFTGRLKMGSRLPLFEPFHWPNLAASFFLLIFPLILVLFFESKKGPKKIFLFSSLFLLACAWLLSQAHLYLLFFITIFLLIAYVWQVKKSLWIFLLPKKELILLVLLLAVTLPNFFPSFGYQPIPSAISLFQDGLFFQERADVWRFSFKTIRNHPWRGIGPNNFGLIYRQNLIKPWTWADYASNELLQTGVEIGLFGLLSQLALFLYLASVFFRKILSFKKGKDTFSLAVSLSLLFFLALGFTNSSFRVFPLQIIFFLLTSFLLKKETTWQIKRAHFTLISLPFVTLFLLFFLDSFGVRRGQQAFLKRNYPEAEKILVAGTKRPLFFLNPKTFYYLAALKLETRKPEEAIFYLEKLKSANPHDLEVDYQIAEIKYAQYQLSEAGKILDQALKKNPFLPPKYYFALAKTLSEEEKAKETLEVLSKMKEHYPAEKEVFWEGQHILKATDYLPAFIEASKLLYTQTGQSDYLPLLSPFLKD